MFPRSFENQVDFMNMHTECVASSAHIEEFTSDLQETFGLRRCSGLFDLANVSDKFRSPLSIYHLYLFVIL